MVRAPLGGTGRALVALAWIALAVASSGCQLLLDFSELSDGGPSGDGSVPADASALCDANEPNDTVDTAGALENDEVAAAICGDGPDFWSFEVTGVEDVTIELTFTAGANDLEMQLQSMAGEVLTISTGTDANEQIEQSAALGNRLEAGTYVIEVLGREDTAMNDYQLTVDLVATPDAGL